MLERIRYVNHINEEIVFGEFPYFVNYNDLRDFSWDVTTRNDRIASFKKGVVSKTLPVIIKCKKAAEGYDARNRMFEVFEKDVLACKHGTLYVGDYYLKCYITGSKKANYLITKDFMTVDLTVQTDYPQWVKETTTVFSVRAKETAKFLDYPHDYAHDYMNVQVNGIINNNNFISSNFRLTFYGPIINPTIYIGGHCYNVDAEVNEGEYLTIDSVDKTIVLTRKNGATVNCFNLRNRNFYAFEKIPVGENVFISPNDYIWFDITLLDERSEPKWI